MPTRLLLFFLLLCTPVPLLARGLEREIPPVVEEFDEDNWPGFGFWHFPGLRPLGIDRYAVQFAHLSPGGLFQQLRRVGRVAEGNHFRCERAEWGWNEDCISLDLTLYFRAVK